ncbi:fasciclin-like arabinogalactan protein 11 [Brachypodium distachyon]|uniref:FAS1 domain-containing protein n=1 Tax=Brachypodium distachyon TaxID=15368 RepID=I1HB11_BRADI|nr:fasciclin-like arabinogalactan protein 11 [Brachypodium distachyon]KQK02229.1 hypothetical protein BRADI_2g00220v3 [Brachypodium distachyon]|eukprot:XP_003565205.1 fasciclin-like arabinogalactan protein 11 [Brachypodium distachyon]
MEAMQRSFLVLLVISAAITASAQGPTAAPTTPAPAAPAPAAGTTKTTNITGVLAKAGQFNTFIRLLRSTGVAAQIDNQLNSSQTGGLTVFAPTDNAFTSLASGTLNSLSDSQKNSLVQFHVLSTAVPMSQFDTVSNPLRTQAGSSSPGEYPLNVTATGQQVNISTGVVNATVDNTLFTGDQLVVYQVNQVLLPMAIAGKKADAPAPAPLGPAKKTPVAADAPGGADADTDSTASRAAGGGGGGGVVAVAMALASCVLCWGL